MKRLLLLAWFVAVSGCDSAESSPQTLLLAGTYTLTIEGYGTFEGEAEGFYHQPAEGLTGLSLVGPVQFPPLSQERVRLSLTTDTFAPGRYRVAASTIVVDSLSHVCGTSSLFEPGAVSFDLTVYSAGFSDCYPAEVTGTVDIVSASEADVRIEFAIEAVPYGRTDTLSVRGRYALHSVGPLPRDRAASRPARRGVAVRHAVPASSF